MPPLITSECLILVKIKDKARKREKYFLLRHRNFVRHYLTIKPTMNTYTLITFVGFLISMIEAQNGTNGNLCWSMPCLNGGSCFGTAMVYMCVCPMYYTGPLCQTQLGLFIIGGEKKRLIFFCSQFDSSIGVCDDNPCGNRGFCIERSLTSYECRCYVGYVGRNCEEQPKIWSSESIIFFRFGS